MPAPPARMRSEKVPCGTSSTSSSRERNCFSNRSFSPTYVAIILRICRVLRRTPRPKSLTPALLLITVRFFVRRRGGGGRREPRATEALGRPVESVPLEADVVDPFAPRVQELRDVRGGPRRGLEELEPRAVGRQERRPPPLSRHLLDPLQFEA